MTDDDFERYVSHHFAGTAEEIKRTSVRSIAAMKMSYFNRGLSESSLYLNDLRLAVIERYVRLARAQIDAREAAHAGCRRPIDDSALCEMEAAGIRILEDARQAVFAEVLQQPEMFRSGLDLRSQCQAAANRDIGAEITKIRREFEMKRIELRAGSPATPEKRWDVFISHASKDKQAVALPLTAALDKRGVKVWLDRGEIKLGDSLRQKIDEGLAQSRYGVVVFSPSFFEKRWPQWELDALFSREVNGEKVILPVLHAMTHDELVQRSPLASGKLYIEWARGVDEVVRAILAVVRSEASS